MQLMTIVYFINALLGIGLIIFIHELGHFLAAKKAGVRVDRFSLGFDPSIRGHRLALIAFKYRGTEYVIGAIPFGGYVKMAGETGPECQNKKDDRPRDDELVGKPPSTRAMVFAAGAVFNIVSAFIFFFLAFRIGVSFPAPVLGHVEVGRPAWLAGLRPGDHVVAIDGKEIGDFSEIAISSALGDPDRPRVLTVRRGDKALEPVEILPEWTPAEGLHTFGVYRSYSSEIKEVQVGSAAARAGIRDGDQFVGIKMDGVFASGPASLFPRGPLLEYLGRHPGADFQLGVKRAGTPENIWVTVELLQKPLSNQKPFLGVSPVLTCVEAVRKGADAARHFAPGDRIRTAADKPVSSIDWIHVLERFGSSGPVKLEVESITGQVMLLSIDAANLIQWSLDKDIHWMPELKVIKVGTTSPLSAILQAGDVVRGVGENPKPTNSPENFARALSSARPGAPLWVLRGGTVHTLNLPLSVTGGSDLGVEWDSMPPVTVFPGSAAAAGGIRSGDKILEVDGRPIRSFNDLIDVVGGIRNPRATVVRWLPAGNDAAESKTLDLLTGDRIQSYAEIGIDFRELLIPVQVGFIEAFHLSAKRTVIVAQQVLMTLKGLFSRQVAFTNLQGPIGIIYLIRTVSEFGLGTFIFYLALLSVNLGLFNLLPFPILDGGHLLFLAIEKIKGSPVNLRVQEVLSTVAFILIIGLFFFVFWNDIRRVGGL